MCVGTAFPLWTQKRPRRLWSEKYCYYYYFIDKQHTVFCFDIAPIGVGIPLRVASLVRLQQYTTNKNLPPQPQNVVFYIIVKI